MALTPEEFSERLCACGLVARSAWEELARSLPEVCRQNTESLARELVDRRVLTAYQVGRILVGEERGLILGNYRILDQLGQGGMGIVYQAEHRRMERVVALKVVSPKALNSADAIQRFQREVKAAAKLSHPNIVAAYDSDEADGTHFLVLEYVDGGDLASLVNARGPVSVETAVDCLRQAARGLEYAHEQGVIHRDIKPANLLLDGKGVVKILDLGLARVDSLGAEQAELTATGQIMGTADYMSPEQALNTRKADQRADIYSLGITLWYLLTGKTAYHGDTVMERIMAHQTAPLPSLRAVRPDVTPEVEAVFRRMIAKSPADRFQTMTEVIAALDRCVAGEAGATSTFDPREASQLRSALKTWTGSAVLSSATMAQPTAREVTKTIDLRAPQADTDPHVPHGPIPLAPSPQATNGKPWRWVAIAGACLLLAGSYFLRPRRQADELARPATPPPTMGTDRLVPVDRVWTTPVNLGRTINTRSRETCPQLTDDELLLVFQRDTRLLQARRVRRDEPFGEPELLTGGVNDLPGLRAAVALSGDGLLLAICAQNEKNPDPYLCERKTIDQPFGPPVLVPPPVSSPAWELSQMISSDGLALFVCTNRGKTNRSADVHQFTRRSRDEPFAKEIKLGPQVNDAGMVVPEWISADGRLLVTTQMIESPFTTRIHVRDSTADEFGPGQSFGPPFEKTSPSSPWLSPDGARMYFHSREFSGGNGELDLWMTEFIPRERR